MPMPLQVPEIAVVQCGRYSVSGRWMTTACRCQQRVNRIHVFWQTILEERVGRHQHQIEDATSSKIGMATAFVLDGAESQMRLEAMLNSGTAPQGVYHRMRRLQHLLSTGMAWLMTLRMPISWIKGRQVASITTKTARPAAAEVEQLMWMLNGIRHRIQLQLDMICLEAEGPQGWRPTYSACKSAVQTYESLSTVHRWVTGDMPQSAQFAMGRMVPTRRFADSRSWIYMIGFSDCGRQYLGSTSRLTRPGNRRCTSAGSRKGCA